MLVLPVVVRLCGVVLKISPAPKQPNNFNTSPNAATRHQQRKANLSYASSQNICANVCKNEPFLSNLRIRFKRTATGPSSLTKCQPVTE
jgi:hypothetical protein